MAIEFRTDITTTIPTSCLIEDCQVLVAGYLNHDWREVRSVIECLIHTIDTCTTVPTGLDIRPSVLSIIAPSHRDGIMLVDNADVKCAANKPVSCCDCNSECASIHGCDPEEGVVKLQNGFIYDMKETSRKDDILLKSLEEHYG